ncbi:MAG: hypothetical protein GEU28_14435 [Dehalococcoidia bacterium]|nr:hypothetical protein [Dehalococcoidia bacterium]
MGEDHEDLANQLFATATAMLEDALEIAVAGQAPLCPAPELADLALRLEAMTREISALAQSALVIARRQQAAESGGSASAG